MVEATMAEATMVEANQVSQASQVNQLNEALAPTGESRILDGMNVRPGLRVGVALGGGAARGLAHLGVLKALGDAGVPIHCLAGVSAGAIIAAGFAAGLSVERLLAEAGRVTWKDVGGWSLSGRGLQKTDRMAAWLGRLIPVKTFAELPLTLRLVATDLRTGAPRVLDRGDLFTAIRASCAIPGLYEPVLVNGELLADGYLSCALPAAVLRAIGADVVIGSSLSLEVSSKVKLSNAYHVLMRSFSIMSEVVKTTERAHADVVIEPDVARFSWADLGAAKELVAAGEQATRAQLPQIQEALNPSFLRRLSRRAGVSLGWRSEPDR